VRILDFSHAAGYVAQIGQVVLGEGTREFKIWLDTTFENTSATPVRALDAMPYCGDRQFQPRLHLACTH
jgi:hypothetical protein